MLFNGDWQVKHTRSRSQRTGERGLGSTHGIIARSWKRQGWDFLLTTLSSSNTERVVSYDYSIVVYCCPSPLNQCPILKQLISCSHLLISSYPRYSPVQRGRSETKQSLFSKYFCYRHFLSSVEFCHPSTSSHVLIFIQSLK